MMKEWKKRWNKVLFPPGWLMLILGILSAAVLAVVAYANKRLAKLKTGKEV